MFSSTTAARGPPSPLGNVKGSSRTRSQFSEHRFSLKPFKADWYIYIKIIPHFRWSFRKLFNNNLPIWYAKLYFWTIFVAPIKLATSPLYIPQRGRGTAAGFPETRSRGFGVRAIAVVEESTFCTVQTASVLIRLFKTSLSAWIIMSKNCFYHLLTKHERSPK